MHPAFSVIFFTTATGAGYGLLALLGLLCAMGLVPGTRWFGAVGLGISLTLVTAGLLSSTLHLTHPERAWRAFSQWRSSWLSREGVMSIATYIPAGLFALGWVILGRTDGAFAAAGILATVFALGTVFTTGMIYASLKPVAQWHSPYTVPSYLIFSIMTGAVTLTALLHLFGAESRPVTLLAILTIATGWACKLATWRYNDVLVPGATLNAATGLSGGIVRSIEWPHTEENFVLKEMGYRVARKHAAKLRRIVQLCAFAVPLVATAAALALDGIPAAAFAVAALVAMVPGMLAERWLFFAEAKHTASVYYGR
jgi:sulfite dehydrogenase (quinone) subunit SoeC